MNIAICGDSWACFDNRWPKSVQWPQIVADTLNADLTNLGRGGADNNYIYSQADWAISNCNPNILLVHWTCVDRFCVKIPNVDIDPTLTLSPNTVVTDVYEHESNFIYENSEQLHISETFSNFYSSNTWGKQYPQLDQRNITILTQYFLNFHSQQVNKTQLDAFKLALENLCNKNNIKLLFVDGLIVDLLNSNPQWNYLFDHLEQKDEERTIMANHLEEEQHQAVAEMLLSQLC